MRVETAFAFILSLAAALVVCAGAEPNASETAPAKTSVKPAPKPGTKALPSKRVASQASPSKTSVLASTSKTAGAKKSAKPAAAIRQSAQQQPTPERYKEIQQALADKGYFTGTADGSWGPDSVDSLKRFQHDQNLPEDGKIGSLGLIALGLGPKHDAGTEVPPVAASAHPSEIDKNIPQ